MSEVKPTVEELLPRPSNPAIDAMRLHPFYKGKLAVDAQVQNPGLQ